jgi:hypothetical protein
MKKSKTPVRTAGVLGIMMLTACSGSSGSTPQIQMGEPADAMAVQEGETEAGGRTPLEPNGTDADCGSPVMTYQCESVPPDSAACLGPTADGGMAYYPLGCVAAGPGCTAPTVPASPIQCTCTANPAPAAFGDAQAVFICPD